MDFEEIPRLLAMLQVRFGISSGGVSARIRRINTPIPRQSEPRYYGTRDSYCFHGTRVLTFSGSEACASVLVYVMMAEPAHERHPGELAVHPLAMPWGLNGQ